MGNGMNKVIDGLYLGNIRDSENRESLSQNGITHILSVYNNAKPVLEDMTYLCIHAADASNQNLLQHFKECIRFIHECRLNGGACLVHCLAGVSRSTTMVVAYLMTVTTYGWEECLSAVKAVRSFVGPNCGFQQQLQQFQRTQVSEYRAWLRTSYRPSPFKDQEQVSALLILYAEQQAQERRRRGDQDWMNQASGPSFPTQGPCKRASPVQRQAETSTCAHILKTGQEHVTFTFQDPLFMVSR